MSAIQVLERMIADQKRDMQKALARLDYIQAGIKEAYLHGLEQALEVVKLNNRQRCELVKEDQT